MPPDPQLTVGVRLRMLDWASLHAHLDWVYEGSPGSFRGTFDQAEDIKAWLILRGSVSVKAGAHRVEATVGQWLVPPFGVVRQAFSSDARILSVRFHAVWPNGDRLIRGRQPIVFSARSCPALETRARRLERMVRRHFRGVSTRLLEALSSLDIYLKVESLFADWLAALAGAMLNCGQLVLPPSPHDARVLTAARHIDRWPADKPFSAAAVATFAGLSVSQLDRLFVRDLHITPHRYFEIRRQSYARAGLNRPSQSVKSLAYQLGFRQASHFSTWFRRQTGLSPKAYRQSLAGLFPEPTGTQTAHTDNLASPRSTPTVENGQT